MSNEEFIEKCKELVKEYAIEHLDKTDEISNFNVFVVWSCKTLQNSKALLSTSLSDGMYYELTMNGDKKEIYFDAYKKFENRCIKIEEKIRYEKMDQRNCTSIYKTCKRKRIDLLECSRLSKAS